MLGPRAERCSTNKHHVWIHGSQLSYPASKNTPRESWKWSPPVTERYVCSHGHAWTRTHINNSIVEWASCQVGPERTHSRKTTRRNELQVSCSHTHSLLPDSAHFHRENQAHMNMKKKTGTGPSHRSIIDVISKDDQLIYQLHLFKLWFLHELKAHFLCLVHINLDIRIKSLRIRTQVCHLCLSFFIYLFSFLKITHFPIIIQQKLILALEEKVVFLYNNLVLLGLDCMLGRSQSSVCRSLKHYY